MQILNLLLYIIFSTLTLFALSFFFVVLIFYFYIAFPLIKVKENSLFSLWTLFSLFVLLCLFFGFASIIYIPLITSVLVIGPYIAFYKKCKYTIEKHREEEEAKENEMIEKKINEDTNEEK